MHVTQIVIGCRRHAARTILGITYWRFHVAEKCSDRGLSIVGTEAECLLAGDALGLGVSSIAKHWDTWERPAGCFDYTGDPQPHKLEFNAALDSTFTSSGWTDMYQICKTSVGRALRFACACMFAIHVCMHKGGDVCACMPGCVLSCRF